MCHLQTDYSPPKAQSRLHAAAGRVTSARAGKVQPPSFSSATQLPARLATLASPHRISEQCRDGVGHVGPRDSNYRTEDLATYRVLVPRRRKGHHEGNDKDVKLFNNSQDVNNVGYVTPSQRSGRTECEM